MLAFLSSNKIYSHAVTQTYKHIYKHTHTLTRTHKHIHTHSESRLPIHKDTNTHTHTQTATHRHTYTATHTHTHTHKNTHTPVVLQPPLQLLLCVVGPRHHGLWQVHHTLLGWQGVIFIKCGCKKTLKKILEV